MDTKDNRCPHCGNTLPKEGLVCAVCGETLTPLMEHTTRFLQPHAPAYSRQRRLITGLVVGGVGLVALGGSLGIASGALNTLFTPATPALLPVDKHRVLNLPLAASLKAYTWLPDNQHLLGFDYQNLFLLDVKSGKNIWLQPVSFPPSPRAALLWSSDRKYVAEIGKSSSGYGSLPDQLKAVVWDLTLRQRIWTSPSLGGGWYACALVPGGASFALCPDSNDPINYDSSKNTTVQIWDIQHNRLLTSLNVQDTLSVQEQADNFAVTTMAWSPDGTRLALICAGGSVQVWDMTASSRLWTYHIANGRGASLQWSPDGSTLAVYLSQETTPPIEVLDAHTGKLLFQTSVLNFSIYDVNGVDWGSEGVRVESSSLLWSNDSTRLALLTSEYRDYEHVSYDVQVCDAHSGQHLFTCQHVEGQLTGCSWSPNGRYLAAGVVGDSSQDNTLGDSSTIQFWDAQSGKALFAYQAPQASGQLIWSPDSHFLATINPQSYGQPGMHVGFSHFALQVFRVA